VLTLVVDAIAGKMDMYVDGGNHMTITRDSSQLCRKALVKDGSIALKGRIAVLSPRQPSDYCLRSVTIHNVALDEERVALEASILKDLLIEDTLASIDDSALQPALRDCHDDGMFTDPDDVLQRRRDLKEEAAMRVGELWTALRGGDANALSEALGELCTYDLPATTSWQPTSGPEPAATYQDVDATQFGATLLHLAAYRGKDSLVDQLLAAGHPPWRRDSSGRTPCDIVDRTWVLLTASLCRRLRLIEGLMFTPRYIVPGSMRRRRRATRPSAAR
jgi:hypothetical protein